MGNHHHHHHHRKQESSGELANLLPLVSAADYCSYRKPTLPRFFVLFAVFSLSFLFVSLCLFPSYSFLSDEQPPPPLAVAAVHPLPCSSMRNGSLCCDRSSPRTDVCFMRGPVRTHSPSNSLLLLTSTNNEDEEQRIRPYTRKWEHNTMSTIDELRLLPLRTGTPNQTDPPILPCDVTHRVPAVVFSTGGYTGNVYHEFNDGILPLYITSHAFGRKVVFVILEYHDWWISKYENILSRLSDHPPIDYANDRRTHCFPEAVVGLRIHDELAIDASRMPPPSNKTIRDFRGMLDEAYEPRIRDIETEEQSAGGVDSPPRTPARDRRRPKLVIVSRNGSRGIENEAALAGLAEEVGFAVAVLRPEKTTELAKIYRALNSSDMMIGVHGAAMTHLLFMRPGAVFVQVVPLGTEWAAEAYYGEPAVKLGLKYVRYEIAPRESSLYREYPKDDPVLRDPESVNAKGWEVTKKVYLDGQNVRLDLGRFKKRLVRSHQYLVSKKWNRKNV